MSYRRSEEVKLFFSALPFSFIAPLLLQGIQPSSAHFFISNAATIPLRIQPSSAHTYFCTGSSGSIPRLQSKFLLLLLSFCDWPPLP
ncbi:unnamed protein product [Cuscuta campestris]|uniref:Uncharacterized protein n=1 Tax=Cuscuta campestris TaxID=132261 RepID=A0A484MQ22_9ASTE|nr:unnamed protein product [Cuscuta campestris]